MDDFFEDVQALEGLVILVAVGLLAYFAWKFYDSFASTTADNGQQKCTLSDMSNGNCVSPSDGSACGWYEYLTATTCYQGTPKAAVAESPAGATVPPSTAQGSSTCYDPTWGGYYPC
jgi:hypothetical protein